MSKYDEIITILDKLHEINFTEIIKYNNFDKANPSGFAFDAEQKRFKEYAIGYCDLCENKCDDKFFKLNNISHGSHTIDFLHSFGFDDGNIRSLIDGQEWRNDPILFLMENPSKDGGHYDYIYSDKNELRKRPASDWYWIHHSNKKAFDQKLYEKDTYFVQGEYGNMVAALIYQYRLANAYLTNLVKCGISDARIDNNGDFVETAYKNLSEYPTEYIKKCVDNILIEEIKVLCRSDGEKLRPLRIFAFGDRPYSYIQEILKHYGKDIELKYQIYQLPHPASRVKNYYRKFIFKGAINESLNNNIFIDSMEQGNLYSTSVVESVFKSEYPDDWLGKRVTKNKYSLNFNTRKSIFNNDILVTSVWVKGKVEENKKFLYKWEIGYDFESKEYWYWKSNKESVKENDIPDSNYFIAAIEKIMKNKV